MLQCNLRALRVLSSPSVLGIDGLEGLWSRDRRVKFHRQNRLCWVVGVDYDCLDESLHKSVFEASERKHAIKLREMFPMSQ